MITEEKIRIIDYQGGRLGPLAYDLASLLFDPYVGLSPSMQAELFREYGSLLRKVPVFFDVNIIYKRVSGINVYMKRVARSDSAVSEKFVIATIVLAFAVFLLEVFL